MWSPVRLADGSTYPYGFGWGMDEQRGERVIEHGGSWQGFRTAIVRYPDRKLSVIVLANLAQAEPERIATTVAGLVDPALALPDPRATVNDPDPARTAALREVLDRVGQGRSLAPHGQGPARHPRGDRAGEGSRERTAKQLGEAKEFVFLAADDLKGRGLERRGEPVAQWRTTPCAAASGTTGTASS